MVGEVRKEGGKERDEAIVKLCRYDLPLTDIINPSQYYPTVIRLELESFLTWMLNHY